MHAEVVHLDSAESTTSFSVYLDIELYNGYSLFSDADGEGYARNEGDKFFVRLDTNPNMPSFVIPRWFQSPGARNGYFGSSLLS